MITPSFSPTATERVLPKLALDFTTASLDPRVTFTRSGNTATVVNSSGNVALVNADIPRFDYTFGTGGACKGLLIEEARTNSCRNNNGTGAVIGTPGTLPTNWTQFATSNLSTAVVATGTEKGVAYVDLRIYGTSTTTFYILTMDNAIAAAAGQTWTTSMYASIVAGSLTNVTSIVTQTRQGGGSTGTVDVAMTLTSTLTRQPSSTLTTGTGATNIYPCIGIFVNAASAVDFTIRIGYPQIEQGAFATSVIPTGSGAVTRNADVATMTGTNFSSWYNATEGTFVCWGNIPSNYSAGFQTFFQSSDGTAANRLYAVNNAGSDVINMEMAVSSSTVAGFYPSYTSGNTKLAFGYKLNNTNYGKDGVSGTTDTVCTVPTMSQLNIGANHNPSNFLNGYVQKLFYYPQRLINAELAATSK